MFNRICIGLVLLACALGAGKSSAAPALPTLDAQSMCATHTQQAQVRYGIPPRLLDAISLVESGHWDKSHRATIAWPWTVSSGGDGKYFPTKADAIAEVRRLKAAGVNNIDVGCMQVNLMYHGSAFASLDEAFDPSANVGYAARFLKGLYESTGRWITAAGYYHSQTPSLAAEYRRLLEKAWDKADMTDIVASAPQAVASAPQPPRASLNQRVDSMRAQWHNRPVDSNDEAKRIADAYRDARVAEYMMRREKMLESRQAAQAGQRIARY